MNRTVIAALATAFLAIGVLAVVTTAVMRNRSVDEPNPGEHGYDHGDWKNQKWIDQFTLTERSGKKFHSQDMQGKVWVASFFFASCPKECVQQNEMVAALHDEFVDRGVTFVSITVDPETDTPAKLRDYAHRFTSDGDHWLFLTGDLLHIRRIGGERFGMPVKRGMHSSKLAIVDKWGEVRGQFDWNQPSELNQFRALLKQVLAESEPPAAVAKTIRYDHGDWRQQDPLDEFTLTERSGKKFHSREMLGKVWVVSFFFTACPSICREQNNHVEALQREYGPRGVTFVSITVDPENDDPAKLREYAANYDADPQQWLFLTGELPHIRMIGREMFNVAVEKETHSRRFMAIDRTGAVRGAFDWAEPGKLDELKAELDALLAEPSPD